jgi:hypothetical protein
LGILEEIDKGPSIGNFGEDAQRTAAASGISLIPSPVQARRFRESPPKRGKGSKQGRLVKGIVRR